MSAEPRRTIRLEVERRIGASPERVFDAWLDPKAVSGWLFATPGGSMVRIELDPRVGGRFVIAERRGESLAEHFGEYVEIERPRRLAFLCTTDRGQAPTRVSITIEPDGDGSLLRLVHEMDLQWADYESRTREGWALILAGLAGHLARPRSG